MNAAAAEKNIARTIMRRRKASVFGRWGTSCRHRRFEWSCERSNAFCRSVGGAVGVAEGGTATAPSRREGLGGIESSSNARRAIVVCDRREAFRWEPRLLPGVLAAPDDPAMAENLKHILRRTQLKVNVQMRELHEP